MLFNMPRSTFTRAQRAAALDWARKLGATNVPTLESFDECERRMEAGQGRVPDNNNLARNCESCIYYNYWWACSEILAVEADET